MLDYVNFPPCPNFPQDPLLGETFRDIGKVIYRLASHDWPPCDILSMPSPEGTNRLDYSGIFA
jgi:hypothetical protein